MARDSTPVSTTAVRGALRRALSHDFSAAALAVFIPWRVVAENPARRNSRKQGAIANQSPLRHAQSTKSLDSKERLRVGNWIMQRLYDYAVEKTVKL